MLLCLASAVCSVVITEVLLVIRHAWFLFRYSVVGVLARIYAIAHDDGVMLGRCTSTPWPSNVFDPQICYHIATAWG